LRFLPQANALCPYSRDDRRGCSSGLLVPHQAVPRAVQGPAGRARHVLPAPSAGTGNRSPLKPALQRNALRGGDWHVADWNPLVTICIPTFNRADTFLPKALAAACNQTYRNLEILVSDNASSDGTPELVRSMIDPRISYHRQA